MDEDEDPWNSTAWDRAFAEQVRRDKRTATMPVGSENARKAAMKQTRRGKATSKRIAASKGTIRNRRLKSARVPVVGMPTRPLIECEFVEIMPGGFAAMPPRNST